MSGTVKRIDEGRWQVRWRTPDGRRPQATFRTRKAAEKYLRDRVDEAEMGIGHVERHATWRDFYPSWEAATRSSVDTRSWEAYEAHWRVWLEPRIGGQRIGDVSVERVQRLANEINQERAPKTVRGVVATWSSMIGMAAAQGRCRPLPRDRASKPRLPQVKRTALTIPAPPEVHRIAGEIIAPFYALVLLCGHCGLRQGEALALHPGDVDWSEHRMWVHQRIHKTTGERVEGTKEDAGAWVLMPSVVESALAAHVAEYPDADYVFNRAAGAAYTASMVDKAWRAACGRAGVRGVRFHDLRHATASAAIASGMNVKQLQALMRHADPAFTLRVYGHLFPDDAKLARARLDEHLIEALRDSVGRVMDAQHSEGSRDATP
jgi:integrase